VAAIGRLRYIEVPPAAGIRPQGALVLLHAFPLNARMWEPQHALAETGWRIIAPQFRGMDGVADPPASTVDDYAGDVIDLLDALHLGDAVIAGLSMGGYVAFAVFRHAPRYFRGIVLADTRPQADTAEAVENRKRMLALVRDKGVSVLADEMVPKLLAEGSRRDRPELVARVRDLIQSNSSDAIGQAISVLMTRPDSSELLSSIHCPALIIVGEHDTLTPVPLAVDMQKRIAGSQMVVVPAAGHVSNLEQPQAFNAALAHFLTHRV
jgi:pimeloyl-ACP methyl ester carboxylesterase